MSDEIATSQIGTSNVSESADQARELSSEACSVTDDTCGSPSCAQIAENSGLHDEAVGGPCLEVQASLAASEDDLHSDRFLNATSPSEPQLEFTEESADNSTQSIQGGIKRALLLITELAGALATISGRLDSVESQLPVFSRRQQELADLVQRGDNEQEHLQDLLLKVEAEQQKQLFLSEDDVRRVAQELLDKRQCEFKVIAKEAVRAEVQIFNRGVRCQMQMLHDRVRKLDTQLDAAHSAMPSSNHRTGNSSFNLWKNGWEAFSPCCQSKDHDQPLNLEHGEFSMSEACKEDDGISGFGYFHGHVTHAFEGLRADGNHAGFIQVPSPMITTARGDSRRSPRTCRSGLETL